MHIEKNPIHLDDGFVLLSNYDRDIELHQLLQYSLDPEYRDFFALKPGQTSADASAIIGKSGFIFINGGSNTWKDQCQGQAIISDDDLKSTSEMLSLSSDRLREIGKTFTLVVYPEKDVVYPEFSPNVPNGLSESRSIHKLASSVQVPIVYPAPQMIENRERAHQFHRRNSHVQFYGGLVAANAVLEALGKKTLAQDEIPMTLASWPDDLSIKWVANLNTFRRRVKPVFNRIDVVVPPHGHVGREVDVINPNAILDESVLIFGDSYSWNQDAGLQVLLAVRFKRVYFVWRKQIDWDLIKKINPTHVVMETAERFLVKGIR